MQPLAICLWLWEVIEAVFKDFLFFHSSGSDLKHSEMLEKIPAFSAALPFICPEVGQTSLGIPSQGITKKLWVEELGEGRGGQVWAQAALLHTGVLLLLNPFLLQRMKEFCPVGDSTETNDFYFQARGKIIWWVAAYFLIHFLTPYPSFWTKDAMITDSLEKQAIQAG